VGDQTTVTPRLMPVPVLNLAGVQAIAAGWHFSLALLEDTTVRAWGYNGYGQLGNNTTTNSLIPVRVLSQNGEVLRNVKKISCGAYYSLALLEDGTVWAWGQGNWGQLGNKRRNNLSSAGPVLDSDGNRLGGVKDISAGPYHALALLKDNGKVVAWGHNEDGLTFSILPTLEISRRR
jgi:adhesin/invasin